MKSEQTMSLDDVSQAVKEYLAKHNLVMIAEPVAILTQVSEPYGREAPMPVFKGFTVRTEPKKEEP